MKKKSLKESILEELELNRGTYRSGQALADRLNVSRAAVWKAVKTLVDEGQRIDAAPNAGYRLDAACDVLSVEGIRARLDARYEDLPVELLRTIDSTNTEMKRRTEQKPDAVLLAEEQTNGRGRQGKSFYAPPFTSIYMSFLIDPKRLKVPFRLLTTAAAVAVSRAILNSTGIETTIKWVNDVFYGDKKIVGILTEAVTSVESGEIERIVVGVGVNCHWRGVSIPAEILEVAAALETDVPRNTIAAELIRETFDVMYGATVDVLEYARAHSYLLGKTVEYCLPGAMRCGVAERLDEEGRLIVRLKDGTEDVLSAGEVSVRARKIGADDARGGGGDLRRTGVK